MKFWKAVITAKPTKNDCLVLCSVIGFIILPFISIDIFTCLLNVFFIVSIFYVFYYIYAGIIAFLCDYFSTTYADSVFDKAYEEYSGRIETDKRAKFEFDYTLYRINKEENHCFRHPIKFWAKQVELFKNYMSARSRFWMLISSIGLLAIFVIAVALLFE